MKRFIEGQSRTQGTLLPECLDDFIGEDNPIRVVDAFVDHLDLVGLGFEGANPAATGRPSYHPGVLLKLYVYGYLNRVQSSRRLEREAQRNVELMWLTERLTPDFKTIADFRRDNGAAIRNVCRQFVDLCRRLKLFSDSIIAIDGSKFKAVNNRERNFTNAKIKARQDYIEESIGRYLDALDTADRTRSDMTESKAAHIKEKIAKLKKQMREAKEMEARLKSTPDNQVSLTDPDARSMATSAKGTGMVGYNVQTAVDHRHHLIVAHEVTNVGNDRSALSRTAQLAQEATGVKKLKVVADRGYYRGEEIRDCEQNGIMAYVPKTLTSLAKADGRFGKQDFVYEPRKDAYRCPAGQHAIHRFTREENGINIRVYWSSHCPHCTIRPECTNSPYRRVRRWEHEEVLERMQRRLERFPEITSIRRETVEHTFGTLKHWMGSAHFLTKTLPRVSTEFSLHVLAYNLKRFMNIVGTGNAMKAMEVVMG